ncbi:MAG: BCCT family transporter [Pseudomonadota bacterium]
MSTTTSHKLDRVLFGTTIAVIAAACLAILFAKDQAAPFITNLHASVTSNMGVFYLAYAVGVLALLAYLAFGKYAQVVLGRTGDSIEFSNLSWIAMLFSTGVGAGLMYWCVIEWGYYVDTPPLGIEARSTEAFEWAASYGLFHWGITGWALFCLPTLAIAYPYYVRREPHLRLSTACLPYLRGGVNGAGGRFVDFLFMLNLLGGTGTSLGLSTPMIAASIAMVLGIEHTFGVEIAVVVLCIGLFGTSAYIGLRNGLKRLSDLNLYLAIGLLVFVLLAGPTLFILESGLNSMGIVLQNFIRMNTWTDPIADTGFVDSWTVFYWAWWIAYGPFVGIFVTRISRGRSIRQVIGGMLIFGSLGAAAFFIVFGNYAMHLELNDILSVTGTMKELGEARAIAEVVASLPSGKVVLFMFFVMSVVFLATTYDSASYTLASVATRNLDAGQDPVAWNRAFWALALVALPVTLMFIDGGLKVVLSATIVVSLPLVLVGVLMAMSLLKLLREDAARRPTDTS